MCFSADFRFLLLSFLCCSNFSWSQWSVLNIPSAGRYDDVFFINDSVGWAAAGNTSRIWKTTDSGTNWTQQLVVSGDYMRCIGFANAGLGFCGSLAGKLYRTTDGGLNWNNITSAIQPAPAGICGICAVDSMNIYACGKWKGPAFLIKSTDAGISWSYIDLSAFASGLNEVFFLNRDTGFVAGKSVVPEEGGIILYTTNGGANWQVVHRTMISGDFVWKIQTPDSIHFYASVEGLPSSGNVRMLRSSNRGLIWDTRLVSQNYSLSQVVGFVDTLRGWTGGKSSLFETNDGGESWILVPVGVNYNRFRRVHRDLAFLTGDKIYRFNRDIPTGILSSGTAQQEEPHRLMVYPVPLNETLNLEVELQTHTDAYLWLTDLQGKAIMKLLDADHKKGLFKFTIPVSSLPQGIYFVVLKTNSGIQYREVIR